MRVRIVCPEHNAYEGEAVFVALPTTDGELGVAPLHASEICSVASGYVRLCDERMGEVTRTFAVDGGYAEDHGRRGGYPGRTRQGYGHGVARRGARAPARI